MYSIASAERSLGRAALPPWWVFLVTGIGWMLVALIVLRFDYTSVSAISILFGIVAIAAGVFELALLFIGDGWWKVHGLLALVFIVAGIVAFIHPGDTFAALAAVFSFVLIFGGTFDIVESISVRHEIDVWWVQLITGIIELALGFWAAGYYGRSAILLVAWVAAFAVIRGVVNILLAFRVRDVQHAALSEVPT